MLEFCGGGSWEVYGVLGTQLGVLGASLENQGQIFGEKLVLCRCGSLWRSTGFWDPAGGLGRPNNRYLGGCWSSVDVGLWRSKGFWDPAGGLGGIFGEPRANLWGEAGLLQMWVFVEVHRILGPSCGSWETQQQIFGWMLVFCGCGCVEVNRFWGRSWGS